jgi:hypothetical protein
VIAGDSVDLEVLQTSAADSGGGGGGCPPGGAGCPKSRPSHYARLVPFLRL